MVFHVDLSFLRSFSLHRATNQSMSHSHSAESHSHPAPDSRHHKLQERRRRKKKNGEQHMPAPTHNQFLVQPQRPHTPLAGMVPFVAGPAAPPASAFGNRLMTCTRVGGVDFQTSACSDFRAGSGHCSKNQ